MHLTLHTDYGLRVLLYLAHFPERRASTREISDAFGISKNHLVRVVHNLAEHHFITTTMGRGGGIALAAQPDKIRISDVVRALEPDFHMVECFDVESNTCPIVPVCGLKFPLRKALETFLSTLDQYSLADVVQNSSTNRFSKLLQLA